jgi:hypothetical protein
MTPLPAIAFPAALADEEDATRLRLLIEYVFGRAEAERVMPLALAGNLGPLYVAHDRILAGWDVGAGGEWVPPRPPPDPRNMHALFEEIAAMPEDHARTFTPLWAERTPDPVDHTPPGPRRAGYGRAKPAGRDRNRATKARVLFTARARRAFYEPND